MASHANNLLQSIASRRTSEALKSLKNEEGESLKAIGTPTNNMILSAIQGECKRNADITTAMYHTIQTMSEVVSTQQRQLEEVTGLMKDLVTIMASTSMETSSRSAIGTSDIPIRSKDFYYKGTKLTNRYYIYGCIISHLINMVYTHMQKQAIRYPDSVDCSFTDLITAIRIVCSVRCSITTIEYGMTINATSKGKPVMESLYRHISSTTRSNNVTLLESSIDKIYNESTREDIFVHIERVMQRLTYLHGIVSPKQMDAMKSIKYPMAIAEYGDELRLNYDASKWTASPSHPVTNSVMELSHAKKCVYIESIMNNKSPPAAYGIAVKHEPAPKSKKS